MKILNTAQQRAWDQYTITHEPIASIDLMERAGSRCAAWLMERYPTSTPWYIVCGPGNNGGDGLVIARLLTNAGYKVTCVTAAFSGKMSPECTTNLDRLQSTTCEVYGLTEGAALPHVPPQAVVVDALLGSGLTRPAEGDLLQIIKAINQFKNDIIAIDLPSGLFGDSNVGNRHDGIVHAHITLTIQTPKRSFFLPEYGELVGEWHVIPIDLHPQYLATVETNYFVTTAETIAAVLRPRPKFSHKGSFGHVRIMAGSHGKMGAAVLACRACLKAGAGLVTAHVPKGESLILQITLPEAMVEENEGASILSGTVSLDNKTLAIGPGIGTADATAEFLHHVLEQCTQPLVLDADALNLLAQHTDWWSIMPKNSILTPHPKEFERLAGGWTSDEERLNLVQSYAMTHQCCVVLKGAHTAIACPDGTVHFNTTGNAGMATAGSGDVLTGIIAALLAQGYTPQQSAIIGVYLHGLAGDLAATQGMTSIIASDIINSLGPAFRKFGS